MLGSHGGLAVRDQSGMDLFDRDFAVKVTANYQQLQAVSEEYTFNGK